ncbi:MAG: hypothetical protein WBE76_31640 [Terracidiphilus sp.]
MIVEMRRSLSILLIGFFSLGPLMAWSGGDDDSRLPACCRRHGQHHCAMSEDAAIVLAQEASGNTPVFRAPSHCPYFPEYLSRSMAPSQWLAAIAVSLPASLSQAHSPAALPVAIRLQPVRARAGRGPPDSFLD